MRGALLYQACSRIQGIHAQISCARGVDQHAQESVAREAFQIVQLERAILPPGSGEGWQAGDGGSGIRSRAGFTRDTRVRHLKPLCPGTQFLMVTVYDNADRVFEALAARASGYLLKPDAPVRLLESLGDELAGGSPMSSAIARKVAQHFQLPAKPADEDYMLTSRERDVLDLLIKGALYKEIASEFEIGIETVRYLLKNPASDCEHGYQVCSDKSGDIFRLKLPTLRAASLVEFLRCRAWL